MRSHEENEATTRMTWARSGGIEVCTRKNVCKRRRTKSIASRWREKERRQRRERKRKKGRREKRKGRKEKRWRVLATTLRIRIATIRMMICRWRRMCLLCRTTKMTFSRTMIYRWSSQASQRKCHLRYLWSARFLLLVCQWRRHLRRRAKRRPLRLLEMW